ncbi:bifunctional glutamate--cysteine ligase GshA/glutathione synthetase GshB [Sediminitomix flava]|uniref:Glutamate--cysteine ligase n=1 Tax=Sediminitomix flava TaxID=379075 RepID=A0A315Z829_SEDFL|nr:bifunctional glutamate--cysteine ligase GshA/glutathione synthetase GshB [Sediminitomix flava]PWJ41081.1 glutamate-cysteine ligase /glutathione synthase [Sediminitomix flava]
MKHNYKHYIDQDPILKHKLLEGNFGIEKENARVDKNGKLALTPHPSVFGDKAKHPFITTDFSESQIEMITPPMPSINEAMGFLQTIHDIVSLELDKGEYLWPQSAPPILPKDEEIPIARYGDSDTSAEEYREMLSTIYGRKVQLISGVHFNFSFTEEWMERLYKASGEETSLNEFRNRLYMKLSRNFFRYRWLLIWLFGKSPAVHKTYIKDCIDRLPALEKDAYSFMEGTSVRSGVCGYRNKVNPILNFDSWEQYQKSVDDLVTDGSLKAKKELYTPLRLKSLGDEENVSYLEVRTLDLNPLKKTGISKRTLHAIHLFLLYCLFKEEEGTLDKDQQQVAYTNNDLASTFGLRKDVELITYAGAKKGIQLWADEIIEEMVTLLADYTSNNSDYQEALEYLSRLVTSPKGRIVHTLMAGIQKDGYIQFHMEKAKEYLKESRSKNFNFIGLEDMELSTQLVLREAVKRGVKFEVLDRAENFIRLKKADKTEYVQQATKTSLDTYSGILLMENKLLTKKVLEEANIRVPHGGHYTEEEKEKAILDFEIYKGKAIVIKPKSTNFGLGITILKENDSEKRYRKAIKMAFKEDKSILIEEFISGKEYRIFIINDEVVGILHRVPANVKGDGVSSIRDLVSEKNKDPLRGKGYRTPLEKIALGEAEKMFLETQGLNFETVPKEGEIIYLRENSNISTGGDSIDYTDDIPDSYKKIAVDAAKALKVKITGLDMMIDHIEEEANENNHAIIEMNFNPAIHIHCHPFVGKNRKLNEKILDALGF